MNSYERDTRVTSGIGGRSEKLDIRVCFQDREVEWLGQTVADRSAIGRENVSGIGF